MNIHRRIRMALMGLLLTSISLMANGEDLLGILLVFNEGVKPWSVNSAGEEVPVAKFYGYKNAATGPGDYAFNEALAGAERNYTPLVVVLDNGNGQGNKFVQDLNDGLDHSGGNYLGHRINELSWKYDCLFTYFKGNFAESGACKDAYDFCRRFYSGTDFPIMVCYWKWPDGTVKTRIASNLGSVGAFETPATNFLKDKSNQPPAELFNRARCSVSFAVKDGELKMTPDTTQVDVPFMRTNSTDAVGSVYGLDVKYPDKTTTNITFVVASRSSFISPTV